MHRISRRRFLLLGASLAAGAATGCQNGYRLFGYNVGAGALYDPNIRTVFVALSNNRAFQTEPYRRFEVDVTQAVVREIGRTTAFRVTSDVDTADTELLMNVESINKDILNLNQQNQIREGEIRVTVAVVWRDLRDGTILSNPRRGPRASPIPYPDGRPRMVPQPDSPPVPFDPNVPVPPDTSPLDVPQPVRIVATGRLIPELGESNASASKRIHDQIAVQIVSMMERRW